MRNKRFNIWIYTRWLKWWLLTQRNNENLSNHIFLFLKLKQLQKKRGGAVFIFRAFWRRTAGWKSVYIRMPLRPAKPMKISCGFLRFKGKFWFVTQDHAKLHVFHAPVPKNNFQIFVRARLSKRYKNFVIILFFKHRIQQKWPSYFFCCFFFPTTHFPKTYFVFSLPLPEGRVDNTWKTSE